MPREMVLESILSSILSSSPPNLLTGNRRARGVRSKMNCSTLRDSLLAGPYQSLVFCRGVHVKGVEPVPPPCR